MSTVEELTEKVQKLMKELETLKQQEEKVDLKYPFEHLEKYWLVGAEGSVGPLRWSNNEFDTQRYEQGHIFKTEQEAKSERDKRELLMRFKQFRDKCNGYWKPDFSQHLVDKYSIQFNYAISDFVTVYSGHNDKFHLFGYFKNEEDADRAIELFGDEIKRLFVEESK